MPTLFVALGGAAGAVLRYRIGLAVGVRSFPWSTLMVNVVGSFVLAWLLFGPIPERVSPSITIGLAVGVLGGFTTFSAFGYETIELARDGRVAAAGVYIGASMVLCLAAAWLGFVLGRFTGTGA